MNYAYRTFLKTLFLTIIFVGLIQAQDIRFSPDSVLTTGSGVESVAFEDFNNDTFMDLAVAIRNESVGHHIVVFLNNGNGYFNSLPDSTYLVGTFPKGIYAGDFDNNDIIDLATANYDDSTVTLLFGNGDGTFGNIDSLSIPNKGEDISIADFNNDLNDDIAVITRGSQLFIYNGNGNGTFSDPVFFSTGGTSADIDVYDLNNDNYLDIIVGLSNSSVLPVLLNNGSGGFPDRTTFYTYRPPWYVQVCNLNSDNFPDIVTGSGSWDFDNVSVLLGDTSGTYILSDTLSPGT